MTPIDCSSEYQSTGGTLPHGIMCRITFHLISVILVASASLMPCRITASQRSAQPKSTDNKQSSELLDRQPLDGSIVGRRYTNKFFNFSIEFPENWIVMFVNQGPQVGAKGVAYALLFVGSRDKQMHGNRWIVIEATRPRDSSLSATSARSLVKKEGYDIDLITSMGLGEDFRPIGKLAEVRLGGRRITRQHFATQVNVGGSNYETRWSQLALVERGCLLMVISSDPVNREFEAGSAVRALNSLRFSGEQ